MFKISLPKSEHKMTRDLILSSSAKQKPKKFLKAKVPLNRIEFFEYFPNLLALIEIK